MVDSRLVRVSVEFVTPSVMAWLAPSEPTTVKLPPSVSVLLETAIVPTSPAPLEYPVAEELLLTPTPAPEMMMPVSVEPANRALLVSVALAAVPVAPLPACAAVPKLAVKPRPDALMALIRPWAVFA